MIQRCTNKKHDAYVRYGGRGISVCEQWRRSFDRFLQDMGPCPGPGFTLERVQNSDGYSPDNCRWASSYEQNRNKRTNVMLTFGGVTQCVADWAKQLGIHDATLRGRIRQGWSIEKLLSTPPRRKNT